MYAYDTIVNGINGSTICASKITWDNIDSLLLHPDFVMIHNSVKAIHVALLNHLYEIQWAERHALKAKLRKEFYYLTDAEFQKYIDMHHPIKPIGYKPNVF